MDSHDAQELIDKQIAAHESAIRDLRTLRNTHAGISRLPIEVLSEIFLLAKLLPGTLYRERYWERVKNRSWSNVAGVCRGWRGVALNAPYIWRTLNTSKLNTLEWAEILIGRSKNVPLHVRCIYPDTPRAVLDLVFSHMAKIQDLEITVDTSLDAEIQGIIDLRGTSSVLQSLALYHRESLFSDDNGGIDRFLRQMPHLLTLDVRCFELPHTISVPPQLRRLHYRTPLGASRTTVSDMLSFLRSAPSLERLEVFGNLRPSDNEDQEMATVELTKLSFLSHTTPEFADTSLFRFLHYPPSSRVTFFSRMPPSDPAACTNDMVSIITRVANSDAAAAIDEVSLAAVDGDHFGMRVSGRDRLLLEIDFPVVDRTLLPLFMLPWAGARTLLIRGFHSVTVADWANFFTRHARVQKLTVEKVNLNFFRALLKPSENEPPPFTRLQYLLLSHCDIQEHTALVKRILEEHSQLEADLGVAIKIKRCRVARDNIRELEACTKVEWDGVEEL